MSRKGESITLSISAEEKRELEAIADQLNCKWGDKPNISALVKAIANKKFQVVQVQSPEAQYLEQLRKAITQAESALRKLKRLV